MQTFSFGTTPNGVIRERLPLKYKMELTRDDMLAVLTGLGVLALHFDGNKELDSKTAWNLRGSILETIGIEEV